MKTRRKTSARSLHSGNNVCRKNARNFNNKFRRSKKLIIDNAFTSWLKISNRHSSQKTSTVSGLVLLMKVVSLSTYLLHNSAHHQRIHYNSQNGIKCSSSQICDKKSNHRNSDKIPKLFYLRPSESSFTHKGFCRLLDRSAGAAQCSYRQCLLVC